MRRITMVRTRDGQLHADSAVALRHAENCYGLALSNLAHKLLKADKYLAMLEAIRANLPAFLELEALKNDCVLPPPDDEGEGE